MIFSFPLIKVTIQVISKKSRKMKSLIYALKFDLILFCYSCVKGSAPKVNDRVLVEASFNANMPFKWNATRIQVLPNQVVSDVAKVSEVLCMVCLIYTIYCSWEKFDVVNDYHIFN